MKDVMNYRDGTYERYLAFNYATKIKSLYNIAINGKMAQQMDFYRSEHPDGTTMYYIGVVFRSQHLSYTGSRLWLEHRYLTTKEEGNRIYAEAKKNRQYFNDVIVTYDN